MCVISISMKMTHMVMKNTIMPMFLSTSKKAPLWNTFTKEHKIPIINVPSSKALSDLYHLHQALAHRHSFSIKCTRHVILHERSSKSLEMCLCLSIDSTWTFFITFHTFSPLISLQLHSCQRMSCVQMLAAGWVKVTAPC